MTHKLTLDISSRDLAHRAAGALENLVTPEPTALTLFETPAANGEAPTWRIEAYYDDAPSAADMHESLEALLETTLPALSASTVPDLNWVAISQHALPPVVAGRFTVHGRHARIAQGPNAILIEAGEAFGTAHHATTYGCLLAIDRLTRSRRYANVLDLGTGSGVLAIAIARLMPRARITASDLDRRSVEVARENMAVNRVGLRIRALQAAGLGAPDIRRAAPFDLIVANILAEPLIALAPDVAQALAPDGTLILSGLLIHQAPAVIAAYRANGLAVSSHDRITGWSTLVLARGGVAVRPRRA
jgi:ribosomal protein L11 methyltransferase